jgi:hypothetical protein
VQKRLPGGAGPIDSAALPTPHVIAVKRPGRMPGIQQSAHHISGKKKPGNPHFRGPSGFSKLL